MIRVSSMRNRIPNLRRGAACVLSLAFLAGVPLASPAQTTYTLPAVLPADSAGREGFLRIVNRSFQAGVVRIHAVDDTGERFGPVTLALDAEEAVHLTSRDLERGSAAKGLPEGVGDGEGSWRLDLDSALDVAALGYIRTSDGFLTSMHDVVPAADGTHRVLFFNPGSNTSKASHLRIVNPGTTEAEVTVMGRDDAGEEASGTVRLTLPAGAARSLSAQQLEAGGEGFDGSLGDGAGKWRLTVTANRTIQVMSLLQSRTGHLSNVSTEPEMPAEGNPVAVPDAVPLALDGGTITGEIDTPDGAKYYTATIEDPGIFDFSASGDVVVTVFDEQGNLVAQSATVAADAAQGEGKTGHAAVPVAVALLYGAYKVHRYYVRIKKRNPGAGRVVFRLTSLYVRLAVRRLKGRIARTTVAYAGVADVDYDLELAEFFEGESDAVVGNISVEPFSVDVPWVGSLTLLEFDTDHVLRVAHRKNRECGTGTDYSSEAALRLRLAWTQQLPGGETKLITHPFLDFGEVRVTIARETAPRRIGGAQGSILVSVAAGASKTVDLSRYIEDPDGGALTFAVSDDEGIPAGWGVTTNGASLTFAASENAVNGEMFVTATDPARECWNFPVRLQACRVDGPRTNDPDTLAPGSRFQECAAPEMVVVPSGSFLMGSPESERQRDDDEGPVHRVTFARPFVVGVYEVTFDEWEACVSGGGCGGYRPGDWGWGRGRRPVMNVSWEDAQAYVAWLSRETGAEYRLLSESEWEYVARAGTRTPFHTGATITSGQANYDGRHRYLPRPGCDPEEENGCYYDEDGLYRERTLPVGSFAPNAFGLHDVHGNLIEWVEDCWNQSYWGAPSDGSAWKSGDCSERMVRGGSWRNGPWDQRSAERFSYPPGDWLDSLHGFRVARTLD